MTSRLYIEYGRFTIDIFFNQFIRNRENRWVILQRALDICNIDYIFNFWITLSHHCLSAWKIDICIENYFVSRIPRRQKQTASQQSQNKNISRWSSISIVKITSWNDICCGRPTLPGLGVCRQDEGSKMEDLVVVNADLEGGSQPSMPIQISYDISWENLELMVSVFAFPFSAP